MLKAVYAVKIAHNILHDKTLYIFELAAFVSSID